jgi:hypothetical protein
MYTWYQYTCVSYKLDRISQNGPIFLVINPKTNFPSFKGLCDKVCHGLATGQWFSLGTLVSTNKTDCHNRAEILLKVALSTITVTITES